MNSGLLFYLAHRTLHCQKQIGDYLSFYELSISDVKICAKKADLNSAMSRLLRTLPILIVVSGSYGRQPDCAPSLFKTLHIPLDKHGEPKGVLRLNGEDKTGYLIESLNQAIAVLPDIPEEIALMLPPACERLAQKFALTGQPPAERGVPFKKMIENSMNSVKPEGLHR